MKSYIKLFEKIEAERKLAEKMLTDKVEAEKSTKDTIIEKETKPPENQKDKTKPPENQKDKIKPPENHEDKIKPLEETKNENQGPVQLSPKKQQPFKPKVSKPAVTNGTSDIKKPKSLKKIYLIGSSILIIIIIAGVALHLSDRTQIVKESVVIPVSTPTPSVRTENSICGIQDIINITRDDFASEQEFRKRLGEAVSTFNHAVGQHDPDYQVATATLSREGLDVQSGKFPLSMEWQLWVKQLDREGYINVPGNKAEMLLKEGEQKPIYIYLGIVEDALRINKIVMVGLEEEMIVSFWPSGTIKHDETSGMDFVWVPGRCFTMGPIPTDGESQVSENETHDVCMNGFWMGRYEVTQAQWERIMGHISSESNNKQSGQGTSNNPAMVFSKQFSLSLNGREVDNTYRLPSEAEWEYAARAGSSRKYCFGDNSSQLEKYAWYSLNSGYTVHPVGQLKPNKWGLYDMYGNAWELCEDFWHPNYDNAPSDGSVWEGGDQTSKVVRGGGIEDLPDVLRSAYRRMLEFDSERRLYQTGFRLVRSGGFLD